MAQPKKWLWGLLPLGLLALLLFYNKTDVVETDLTTRVSQALSENALDSVEVALSGRDAMLTGLVETPEAKEEAEALANSTFGVRVAKSDITVIPLQSPHKTSYTLENGKLVLSGYARNQELKSALIERAKEAFPNVEIIDEIDLARGAPDDDVYLVSASYAFDQLKQLENGSASLVDGVLSLSGEAATWPAYSAVTASLANPEPGLQLGEVSISEPPLSSYVFKGALDDTNLTLTGFVPSEDAKASILEAASLNFVGVNVVDETTVQEGAPQSFLEAAISGLQVLSRLQKGGLTLAGTDLNVEGASFTQSITDAIKAQISKAVPTGFAANAALENVAEQSEVDINTCSDFIKGFLQKGEIRFASGSADLSDTSSALLDRVSYIAGRCPNAAIEIAGHTDSDGADEANMTLSQNRAEAVKAYLVGIGIAEERLQAVGYGETQPVASNDTAEGKAQNRRIEFKLSE